MQILLSLIVIIFTVFSCTVIDASKLTHVIINGVLVDKWHEESCIGTFDGNGNYIGESCSDEYTIVVIDNDNDRHEYKIDRKEFGDLLTKSLLFLTIWVVLVFIIISM